jgi:hypothetical protein
MNNSMKMQNIMFEKKKWKNKAIQKWLKMHKLIPIKSPDITKNFIRIRLIEPYKFTQSTFRIISFGNSDIGIKSVVGKLKKKYK